MELSRNALGNLINRYRAVLRKCRLLNTFGALAVAAMLVMGTASGEAFSQTIGYDVTSPASTGPTVSVTDNSPQADARGINAFAAGEHDIPATITRAEATATGTQEARSFGMLSESNTGAPLTVRLDSLEISSQATTEDGEGRSFGIYSYDNSTVSMKGGSVTSSAQSNNGDSTAYGIFSGESSRVTSGAGSVTASSSSGGSDTWVNSYGIQADGSSSFTATNPLIKIEASATSREKASQLFAYGINAESDSTVTLNNADITVQTKTDHQLGYNTAYGVSLGGDSQFSMKDGSIRVAATDISGKAFTGDAVGIMTNSGGDSYQISLGTVDIQAEGENASGLALAHATMGMAGGSITAKAHGGQAQGLNANGKTTFTATGDIDFTARAEGSKAVAIRAEGESVITALGGAVIASGDKTAYDSIGAVGLEASSGGSITKSGGDVTVSSLTGRAVGLDAQDNSHPDKTYRASKITYGNAGATTRVTVAGNDAYGIRAMNPGVTTSDGQGAAVELTNGDITVTSSGGTAVGAYSASGDIKLKGTTAITASAGATGQHVYSLYATGNKPSTITVDKASTIEGDIAAATNSAAINASIQDGGHLKGWTRGSGTLDLAFGKNAVWEMVSSNTLTKGANGKYSGNLTRLALDGSHVYVGSTQKQWEAGSGFASSQTLLSQTDVPAELKIKSLSGSGNFYLRTDMRQDISDSVLVTEAISGTHNLYVKGSGKEPVQVQTKSYLARAEQGVVAVADTFRLKGGRTVNGRELIDIGLYNYALETSERNNGREWYLGRAEGASPTGETVLGLSGMASAYAMYMGQLSDLRERLGEIRYGNGTDGLWVRGFTQENRLSGLAGIDFSQNFYGTSFGYDHLVEQNENNRWLFGLRGQLTRAEQRIDGLHDGSGDSRSYGIAAYATWQHTDGWYSDTVLTWDWYDQNLKTRMLDGTRVHGSYNTYAGGISQEVGRMFRFGEGFFIEPQLQLSWYWMKGTDFTTSNGMRVEQDDAYALTGRAGLVLGKKWDLSEDRYFQPYLKGGVNHEFMGDQKVTVNDIAFSDDLRGTRIYYGAGFDVQFASNARFYAEFEREDGNKASTPWSVSAGLRIAF